MKRWPPVLWLGIFVASLLILRGSGGETRPGFLIAGGILLVADFLIAAYLALRPGQGPLTPLMRGAIAGVAALYVAFAAAAALSGGEYAVAAIFAGLIPLTAVCLWVATVRQTTAEGEESPYPGIALDEETPLGDTPEHSEAFEDEDETEPRPTPRFRRNHRRASVEK